MSEWSESRAFGELRSRVNGPRTGAAFRAILRAVERAEREAPGVYAREWRAWLESNLEPWPSSSRAIPATEESIDESARAPWFSLVRGLIVHSIDFGDADDVRWLAEGLLEQMPALEHLSFDAPYVSKKGVVRACEAGVFSGLRSLEFEHCVLKGVTCAPLFEALAESRVLEHLSFTRSLSRDAIASLTDSPWLSRLRTLSVTYHDTFESAQALALAEVLSGDWALERLDLDSCPIGAKGVEALAAASLPGSLAFLGLHQVGMKRSGAEALRDAGLVGLIARDGRLDLNAQGLGTSGFEALVRAGVLEGVTELDLTGCRVGDLSVLGEVDVSGLRAFACRSKAPKGLMGALDEMSELVELELMLEDAQLLEFVRAPVMGRVMALDVRSSSIEDPECVRAILDWEGWGRGARVTFCGTIDYDDELWRRIDALGATGGLSRAAARDRFSPMRMTFDVR